MNVRTNGAADIISKVVDVATQYATFAIGVVSQQNLAVQDAKFQQELEAETTELNQSQTELTEVEIQIQQEQNKQKMAIVVGGLASLGILGGMVWLTSSPSPKKKKVVK